MIARLILLALLASLALPATAQPVCADSGECGHGHQHKRLSGKRDRSLLIPVFALGVGTGVGLTVLWLKRDPSPPPEPAASPVAQERVLTITPDIKVYQ